MKHLIHEQKTKQRITFAAMSTPAKALATCVIITLTFGMLGALGQIAIHDIIPTFYSKSNSSDAASTTLNRDNGTGDHSESKPSTDRGDLFSDLKPLDSQPESKPLYHSDQFVWTLKWTHIHLFGMNMIFILMGGISLLLDVRSRFRTWLVVLPFVGVLIDISAMWLKGFVSPIFIWLHIPGGSLFAAVFGYVSLRALWEMWFKPAS